MDRIPAENRIAIAVTVISVVLSGTILTLIVRHWQTATGWSRRAMAPLVVISFSVVALNVIQNVASVVNLPVSGAVIYDMNCLVLLTGPLLVVITVTRTRRAVVAVSTALIDLEPGPAPERLREALAEALGDPELAACLPAAGWWSVHRH